MAINNKLTDLIANGAIQPDSRQLEAIQLLEEIARQLSIKQNSDSFNAHVSHTQNKNNGIKSLFTHLKKINTFPAQPINFQQRHIIPGLYLWGAVGRGKTWLMDQFYHSLKLDRAIRIHFHEFMLDIHKRLQELPNQPDPLEIIGAQLAQKYDLICLDEFHVMDIADAVILHGLLKALFENGLTIVTTSNRHPDDLYKNGSHRERFLPAIALIKEYTTVFHLDTNKDYRRLQGKPQQDVFFIPHTTEVEHKLEDLFNSLSNGYLLPEDNIKINGREIAVKSVSQSVAWFDFDTLCRGMRASSDYLQIAKNYQIIILSEIPQLHEGEEGPARRFLNLIDAFYDQHVYLILSSYSEIEKMYQGELLQFEFERAQSRLHEMQTDAWWQNLERDG